MTSFKKLQIALGLMAALFLIGTAGYVVIEGYAVIDALFMTVITLATVGYSEVRPLHDAGKVFTIFLIVAGIGTVAFTVTQAVDYIIDTILFRAKLMEKKIAKLSGHVIICGYGRIGRRVAAALKKRALPFVVVERDQELVGDLEREGMMYVLGNASDDDTLRRAGIERANTIVATLPSNADNVYTILSARHLNPAIRIVARAIDTDSTQKLVQAGADKVISPYDIGGYYLANAVLRPHVVNFMEVVNKSAGITEKNLEIEELEVTENCRYANKPLRETGIRSELNIIVLAIRNKDGQFEYNPSSETILEPGSMIICIGFSDKLDTLARNLGHCA